MLPEQFDRLKTRHVWGGSKSYATPSRGTSHTHTAFRIHLGKRPRDWHLEHVLLATYTCASGYFSFTWDILALVHKQKLGVLPLNVALRHPHLGVIPAVVRRIIEDKNHLFVAKFRLQSRCQAPFRLTYYLSWHDKASLRSPPYQMSQVPLPAHTLILTLERQTFGKWEVAKAKSKVPLFHIALLCNVVNACKTGQVPRSTI